MGEATVHLGLCGVGAIMGMSGHSCVLMFPKSWHLCTLSEVLYHY